MSNLIACTCTDPIPAVSFTDCPDVLRSEIVRVFIGKPGYAFNDWTDAAEWAARLSDTWQDPTAIRELKVIGDKPAPDTTKITISDRRQVVVNKAHTLNFEIDEVNDTNYELVNALECNGSVNMWYMTIDNKMYGGNDGIQAQLELNDVLDRGNEAIDKLIGVATWNNKFSPARIDSPVPVNL